MGGQRDSARADAAAVAMPSTVPLAVPLAVPAAVLVDALVAVAAAGSRLDVAQACLPLLLEQPGVRAGAVVERAGSDVVVQGSAGYPCGSMAPGARLPLDAGLPVTEAVRTGSAVVRGTGPGWVAVPFPRPSSGALLLSLDGPPPASLAPLTTLAHAVGGALRRVRDGEQALIDLARLTAALAPPPAPAPPIDAATLTRPAGGPVGGDVLLCLPDGRGGTWLVAADVCGSGLVAALVARSVETAVSALAPSCTGPAALLQDLERTLRPVVGPDSFVTAVVVRVTGAQAAVASAGHPPPLLLTGTGASTVELVPGPPLALETGPAEPYEQAGLTVPAGAVLLLHTDGLIDREGHRGADPLALVDAVDLDDLTVAAAQVLAAAERLGPALDDASVLLARPFPLGR